MNKEILLRMENIVKAFPGVKALDEVNLEVYKGEILGISGLMAALLLEAEGFTQDEIDLMTRRNPARFLGLE